MSLECSASDQIQAGWVSRSRVQWRDSQANPGARDIPEETPVALTYDASTYAVMMATPLDLQDFALGFSLTEGVIAATAEISAIEVVESDLGMEARMWLAAPRSQALASRRRHMAGPTGCGLCGIDSLGEAVRTPRRIEVQLQLSSDQVLEAIGSLYPQQHLNAVTRAVHAAGFWRPDQGLVAVREDVGRHNALDKLCGALARLDPDRAGAPGAILLTSRVSVEMVQKAAVIGAPILIAVSAPTALAVRTAEAAGITLVAIARSDGFEVFTHVDRITP
ncbi:MAG: formate dehydrogenase accessory sulfurtransferase FdhD [Caulobacteraceae bacterium]